MPGQNYPRRRFKINLCFCSHFDFFAHFHRNYSSNRQNIIKFVISGSEKVEIDTQLTIFQTFYFYRLFWFFFSKTQFVLLAEVTERFCWFSISNIERQLCIFHFIWKKIRAKLRPWECRKETSTKCPPWSYQFWIIKI